MKILKSCKINRRIIQEKNEKIKKNKGKNDK